MVNAYKVRLLSSELFYIFPHCYVRRFILLFSNKFAALKWKVIFQEEVLLMIFFVSYSIVWSHQKLIFEILQEIFFSFIMFQSVISLLLWANLSELVRFYIPLLKTSGNLNFFGVFEGYRSEIIHVNLLEFQ